MIPKYHEVVIKTCMTAQRKLFNDDSLTGNGKNFLTFWNGDFLQTIQRFFRGEHSATPGTFCVSESSNKK